MIQNKTARRLMYEWHSGMSSHFYAAASSGLCASFMALAIECDTMDDPKEKQKLLQWIMAKQKTAPELVFMGRVYRVLPWVHRSYFGETAGRVTA